MFRALPLFLMAAVLTLLVVGSAMAQSASWPDYPLSGNQLQRGPGGYLAWWKLLAGWLLFLAWVKTTDWVNQDCQQLSLPYAVWNPVVFFPFFAGMFLLLWSIPIFFVGWPLMLLAWLIPLGAYVIQRNSAVEPHERVMTRDHLRFFVAHRIQSLGLKVDAEKKARHQLGAQVTLKARGSGSDQLDQANVIEARQSPGFLSAKELIATTADRRAEKVMLDYSAQGVALRYQIDGVWHDGEAQERQLADQMLAVFKKLAALNIKERRARQEGLFVAEYNGKAHDIGLVSQGTKTGERVVLQLVEKVVPFQTFEELGMRAKLQEQLRELLRKSGAMILFSSNPGDGLTTLVTVALRMSDRYMHDVVAVLEKSAVEPLVENVEITTYDASAGQTPASVLPSLIRKQPDVLTVYDLPNAETVSILCKAAQEGKRVLTTVRAKEAVEALLRVLLLKIPAEEFAAAITAVVNQRLVRRLCQTCRQAYTPAPELLKKLGLPADRVQSLYRPPENPEEVCPDCHGIGYRGRTAIVELLMVDDAIRQALVRQPKLDVLRAAARKGNNRSLQEEGMVLVARGVTSLVELKRVLEQ